MTREWIPYEYAFDLKRLGFEEECIYHYKISSDGDTHTNVPTFEMKTPFGKNYNSSTTRVSAPLWQQAFRWFRNKHKMIGEIDTIGEEKDYPMYHFNVVLNERSKIETLLDELSIDYDEFVRKHCYNEYEEAEVACLRKLIEILAKKIHAEKLNEL